MIRWLLGRRRFLFVAFVDVVDSVGLYRRLGDWDAKRRIDRALAHVSRQLGVYAGRVIKLNGDGLLCAFGAPEQAYDALLSSQRCAKLKLRMGVHAGPVMLRRGDAFGNAVNIAARLSSLAGPSQIVISAAVRDLLTGDRREACRRFDRLRIRGTGTEFQLYQIHWDCEAATAIVTQMHEPATDRTLVLRHGEQEVLLDGAQAECTLGRDPSCALIVDDPRASRFHATVEHRRGQFVLRDHSTNGSFVLDDQDARPLFIRREEWVLAGEGRLSFGQPFDDGEQRFVEYRHS